MGMRQMIHRAVPHRDSAGGHGATGLPLVASPRLAPLPILIFQF
jgi:hypothetical protein